MKAHLIVVLRDLKRVTVYAREHSDEFYAIATKNGEAEAKKFYATADREKRSIEERIVKISNILRCMYEDRVEGRITVERYDEMAAGYEQEQAELKQELASVTEKISELDLREMYVTEFIAKAREYVEIVSANDINNIIEAFAEFDNVYNACNDASIFTKVPASKSRYSLEENTEMILDYMDEAICRKACLTKFLLSTKKNSPTGMNTLYVFDRETKQFNGFADREDAMKRTIDVCTELTGKLNACYVYGTDTLFAYFDGFQRVLDKISSVCQRGIDAVESFRTKKDNAPYAIMHYPALVKDCVNKYSLGSLSDPFAGGTNYREIAQKMISKFQTLAKNVAKSAPN